MDVEVIQIMIETAIDIVTRAEAIPTHTFRSFANFTTHLAFGRNHNNAYDRLHPSVFEVYFLKLNIRAMLNCFLPFSDFMSYISHISLGL